MIAQLWTRHGDVVLDIVAAYGINTIATLILAKVQKTGRLWKALRILHGILDRVDPAEPAK